ncbi:MAG: molecular chaperone HtpG [Flavobacteriales bacterium]|jgi:molecular chaperone HtpG|tara:strand:+ start:4273 stop:6159 length:1887 start_codon:yes stop_codon:yes gene_type:complete
MAKGNINVQAENIFPIIKQFLYSDQEIFLRELVSNAVDACRKLQALSSMGETKGALGELQVEIIADKEANTLTIRDNGLGMTGAEIEKYIAQIAFSGAEEFVQKYEDKADGIIGHFGLGFFSAFMVADKVEVFSKSYKEDTSGARWICEGSTDYDLDDEVKETRGTDIILHISDDAKDYLEQNKVSELLNKYCKFLPIEVKFGTKEETLPAPEAKEGEEAPEPETITVDNVINNPTPAWTKAPADLEDVDYKSFYRELYPMSFEEPLFHIHLNVDFPFNLTGILYFPKLSHNMEVQKNKIQLYCNQVFVTDQCEGIVPDFLTLLHGVIDSPDIPLNVSRSYLQADQNVKKISSHITKKVADKLKQLATKERADFEKKWDDIKVFIEFGLLSDDKFADKAKNFMLYKNVKEEFFLIDEYLEKIKATQENKEKKTVILYTHDATAHHAAIVKAEERGYDVLVLDTSLSSHMVNKLEQSLTDVTFARIDSDTIDKLISRDEEIPSKLSKEEEEKLKPVIEGIVNSGTYQVQFESLSETDAPIQITQSEFMRRMMEMQKVGGQGGMMGNMPESYNLVVNSNHPLVGKILNESDTAVQSKLAKQTADLALLSVGLLKGKDLTDFVNRSIEIIE